MAGRVAVLPIEDHCTHAAIVAKWVRDEWRRLPIHDYLEAIARGESWNLPLPRTLIAIEESSGEIVGTASLLTNDMESRSDLNPWFGCLFVLPSRRKTGIGGQLVASSVDLARTLHIQQLYLFAAHDTKLYERFGWTNIGREFYENCWNALMVKNIS